MTFKPETFPRLFWKEAVHENCTSIEHFSIGAHLSLSKNISGSLEMGPET